jgi:hypothetical protein
MSDGLYYLNNSGSRWVVYSNGKLEKRTWLTQSGKEIRRAVLYYFSFGNFGGCVISYKGERIRVLADSILED